MFGYQWNTIRQIIMFGYAWNTIRCLYVYKYNSVCLFCRSNL